MSHAVRQIILINRQFFPVFPLMKAICVRNFGGPEVLELVEMAVPETGAGLVRVRLHAIGVNPVDTYWRSGANPSLKLPFTPGLDAAGEVDGIGDGVTGWKVGDRVYLGGSVTGTYAGFALARPSQLHPLPDGCSFETGACLHVPYATARLALLQRGEARAGDWVMIHGASGGVGLAACQFAVASGLKVIGTAGSQGGRDLVLQQGVRHVLDHTRPGYLDEVLPLTGGVGLNVILEMLSNVNLGHDLPLLAKGGRVVVVGSRGTVQVNPRDLMFREADIRGFSLFNATDEALQAAHVDIREGLVSGRLKPQVGRRFDLPRAADAHRAVLEPGALGKILLIPSA